VDSFKGKMAFIRKSAWIVKPMGGMEPTKKPKAIPHAKQGTLLSKEDQNETIDRDMAV